MIAIEDDILAELAERDLEVHQLRGQLADRGREVTHEGLYQALVQLEAADRVRIDAAAHRPALWGAR